MSSLGMTAVGKHGGVHNSVTVYREPREQLNRHSPAANTRTSSSGGSNENDNQRHAPTTTLTADAAAALFDSIFCHAEDDDVGHWTQRGNTSIMLDGQGWSEDDFYRDAGIGSSGGRLWTMRRMCHPQPPWIIWLVVTLSPTTNASIAAAPSTLADCVSPLKATSTANGENTAAAEAETETTRMTAIAVL